MLPVRFLPVDALSGDPAPDNVWITAGSERPVRSPCPASPQEAEALRCPVPGPRAPSLLPAMRSPRTPARGRHRVGKHAAAGTSRSVLLPGLLVVGAGAGLLGAAGLPTASEASEVRAAAPPAMQALQVARVAAPLAGPLALTGRHDAAALQTRASRSRRTVQAAPVRPARVRPAYVRPVPGPVSSHFGRRWGRLHAGIDVAVPVGTPVRAVAAGRVVSHSYDAGGYGHHVVVRHADGTTSLYAHLSSVRSLGRRVVAGQVLGRSGNTGHSTGPHLHFEMRRGDRPFDPEPWLARHGIDV